MFRFCQVTEQMNDSFMVKLIKCYNVSFGKLALLK